MSEEFVSTSSRINRNACAMRWTPTCWWLGELCSLIANTAGCVTRSFSVNTKSPLRQVRLSTTKSEIRSSTSCPRRKTFRAASLASRRRSSMSTSSASSQKFNRVSFYECWRDFLMSDHFILDIRAIPQEVSVTVKKGVETKSYEGVSTKSHIIQNNCDWYLIFIASLLYWNDNFVFFWGTILLSYLFLTQSLTSVVIIEFLVLCVQPGS